MVGDDDVLYNDNESGEWRKRRDLRNIWCRGFVKGLIEKEIWIRMERM